MSSSQPVPLNGAAASDCESLESYGSSSYASGAGGAGDATPSKRMSSRKRKDVNYKERKERKLPTVVASPVAGLGQEEEVTSSVTLNEEPTTSKSHGEINSSKAFPSDTKRQQDESLYDKSASEGFLNQSGSFNFNMEINSKFYTFNLARQAYQVIYDKAEKFVPERVEMTGKELILLSSAESQSRFTFFDPQTLEVNETSEFPFLVLDFCVGKNSMFFTNGKQLFVWKLENRELGYDTLDLPDIEVAINSLSAVNDCVGMIYSRNYSYFESVLLYKVLENRKAQSLDAIKQHKSDLNCKIDPFSFTMLENCEDKFVAMKQVKRQITMYKVYSRNSLIELMKFSMSQPGIEGMRITPGPTRHSLLAVIHYSRGGSSLAFLDWKKKTVVTLLTSDQSEMRQTGNVNNPIGCCLSQSKLAMINHENFQDRQRLSLFGMDVKNRSSGNLKFYLFLIIAILVCVAAIVYKCVFGTVELF